MGYQSRGGKAGTRGGAPAPPVPREKIIQAINEGGRSLGEVAEELGHRLYSERLTTSQIRNIYGVVKKMQLSGEFDPGEFVLLKPKLAYQAKRERGGGVQELANVLIPAIDLVGEDRNRFQNFVDFFEAILAYHTAAGAR